MCRACHDANGNRVAGRRCPSDTNEARRLRWQAAKAATGFTARKTDKVQPPAAKPTATPTKSLQERVLDGSTQLRELTQNQPKENTSEYDVWAKQVSEITIQLGADVEQLAEEKYGAPTDEQLAAADKTVEQVERLESLRDRMRSLNGDITAKTREMYDLNTDLTEQFGDGGIEGDSHDIIAQRVETLKKEHPEAVKPLEAVLAERSRLTQESDELSAEFNTLRQRAFPLFSLMTPKEKDQEYARMVKESEYGALIRKRNEALRSALEDSGVEFAKQGDLQTSQKKNTAANKAVQEASTFFPKTWVESSNTKSNNPLSIIRYRGGKTEFIAAPLDVSATSGRAGYIAATAKKTKGLTSLHSVEQRPQGWEPPVDEAHEWVKLDQNIRQWKDPIAGDTYKMGRPYSYGHEVWVHQPHVTVDSLDKVPENVRAHAKQLPGTPTRYAYPRTTIGKTYTRTASLTVSTDYNTPTNKNPRLRVALHELSHRMDHSNIPAEGITSINTSAISKAFRRTRALEDGGTQIQALPGCGRGETGVMDHFIHAYMGRVYNNDNDDGGTEIMSMGMETLFSGTHGGFAGAAKYRPDKQYKQFIIGLLASSAADPRK